MEEVRKDAEMVPRRGGRRGSRDSLDSSLSGGRKEDELENELGLANNCLSELYQQSTELVDLALKLMDMELVESGQAGEQVRNRLRRAKKEAPKLFERHFEQVARIWQNTLVRLLVQIVVPIYFLLKYSSLAYLQAKHDHLSSNLIQFQPTHRTNYCSQVLSKSPSTDSNSSSFTYRQWQTKMRIESELDWTKYYLDQIGSPFSGTSCSFIYTLVLFYPVILASFSWLTGHICVLRLDWLGFLFEPQRETERIRLALDKQICVLFNSIRNHRQATHLTQLMLKIVTGSRISGTCATTHLNHRWHRRLMRTTRLLFLTGFYGALTASLMWSSVFITITLHKSLNDRLKGLACGGRSRLNLQLGDDLRFYQQVEGDKSWSHFLFLILLVEPKHALSKRALFTWIEMSFLALLVALWYFICLLLYLMTIVDKLMWLNQVNRQLARSIRAVQEGAHEQFLLKLCTRTYLSYSLFRSQFGHSRQVARLLIFQMAMLNLINLYAIYVTKRTITEGAHRMGFLAIAFFNFFCSLNGYFVIYSYLFLLIERAQLQIGQLLASIENKRLMQARLPIGLGFWLDMWQRQLLDVHEINRLYGLSLLNTIQVRFYYLVQINIYPMAILSNLI